MDSIIVAPTRIRSLSKPAIPKTKDQRKWEYKRGILKQFSKVIPSLTTLLVSLMGDTTLQAYRFARLNKTTWNIAKIDNFCLIIQEKVQKTNFIKMFDTYPDLSKYKGNLSFK